MRAVKVRKASLSDSEDIFHWRNDIHTRQMSRATDKVDWNEHSTWFANTLDRSDRLLLICEDERDQTKLCVIRFDSDDCGSSEISINLNPNIRGKRYAKSCLIESIRYLRECGGDTKEVIAEIKDNNTGSIKTFVGVGFNRKRTNSEGLGIYEYIF